MNQKGLMLIREATERDIPGILEVLKSSLGEISSKKTERVWRYKHIDNPFGRSLVLIAVENDKIIGVRALMRWAWQLGDKVFLAFRAVDTATHPEHQGKGVFKRLTMKAIDIAKQQKDDFIFNTPNSQSLPGYLKMDWGKVDNIKLHVKLTNPINWVGNKADHSYHINKDYQGEQLAELTLGYNGLKRSANKLFTIKSPEYLFWRYENNPLQDYEVKGDQDFYFAAYIKGHKYFKELRITEHLYFNDSGKKKIKRAVAEFSRKFGAQIITSSNLNFGLGVRGNYGPILALRNVNLETRVNQKLQLLDNWSYTLGDLELF